jgi:hypothetical protein
MKFMPILIAMLLVGNVVATEWPDAVRPSFDIRKCDITPGAVIPRSSATDLITKPVDPNVAWAASPSKVGYWRCHQVSVIPAHNNP